MGNCKDHHHAETLVQLNGRDKSSGKEYWRSLEELADTPEFQRYVEREFPSQASEFNDPAGRRTFLKLMGASLALAGIGTTACTVQPTENVVPYVVQPEEEVPGKALFFATAMQLGGSVLGLLAKSNEGRPTKIEGNPDHPASLGSTDIYAQAAILDLYDPDRAQTITSRNEIQPWSSFVTEIRGALDASRIGSDTTRYGSGIRILTETMTSPTLANQLKTFLTNHPGAKWHQYEPAGNNGAALGAMLAFGQPVNTIYHLDRADRVLSLGSDFLSCIGGRNVRLAHDFARKRRPEDNGSEMNRLYTVESTFTNTGAMADHRLLLRPSEMEGFARAVAAALGANGAAGNSTAPNSYGDFLPAVVKDLQSARGASVVIAGEEQQPVIHALAHAINAALGNVGNTVTYTDPVEANPVDQMQSLRELVQDLNSGAVSLLLIFGGNPVYNAPSDLNFPDAIKKAKLAAHLTSRKNETSEWCQWLIPEAHFLESWGDLRSFDGTASIVQPLIEPLYGGKSAYEIMGVLNNENRQGYETIRAYWQGQMGGGNFEQTWRRAVHDGVIANTAFQPKSVGLKGIPEPTPNNPAPVNSGNNGNPLEIIFRPDPTLYDGRFANNGWLQELPKPLSKLTWDNAAYVSENTARRLGLGQRIGNPGKNYLVDTVTLSYQGRSISDVPIWVLPGHADDCLTLHLGSGQRLAGRVGSGVGFNAYQLRTSDAPWQGTGLTVAKTGNEAELAATQLHFNISDHDAARESAARHPIRSGTLEEYKKDPAFAREMGEEPDKHLSMYEPWDYSKGYAWGMAVDINNCVGCNTCIIACQAENNIPVVGKEQIMRSREMHWLRVDTYFRGAVANPQTYFQPIPCMHCENAPCEVVCPVNATVHSAEGTNDMVYNRCVGTRYCSNNCPYKVRRFNFLLYQDWNTPSLKLMRNPEVSVRSRGVMEKCTYCIQRVEGAKIEAEKDGRPVRDGEILTACQAACPTDAIIFGNINDHNSRVAKIKAQQRNYSLLGELNTQPRTTYLSALRNPNPELGEKA